MYEHYIAVDWAQANMAIARLTPCSNKPVVIDVPTDLEEFKLYLSRLRGRKILTFEETTTSQWLYTELKSEVDEVLVCDPYRNHLLSEGPSTDKIDAVKLVTLLRANLLKPVFHSAEEFIYFRKLISGYQDVVKAGVRIKNQRAALFRAQGLSKKAKELNEPAEVFVLKGLDEAIESYEREKTRYEEEFHRIYLKHKVIRNLESIPGIGEIGAVKIAAIVVAPGRFLRKGPWLSYCGLVKLDLMSGGRSYGKKNPRCCKTLKGVFKTAAMSVTVQNSESPFREYYEYLLKEKGYPEYMARHAVARRIAVITYGVLKTGRRFEPKQFSAKKY